MRQNVGKYELHRLGFDTIDCAKVSKTRPSPVLQLEDCV
eukprot:SAG22_NODE_20263_length_267_cov_0.613095_1_plen_38_part_10